MAKALAGEANKSFDLAASFDTDLAAGRIDVPTLSAELLGLSVRGGVKGQNVDFDKGSGTLDGQLKVSGKDIGPLLRGLGQADMAKAVKTLDLDAGIKGSLNDLNLSPLALTTTVVNPEVGKPVDLKLSAGSARACSGLM